MDQEMISIDAKFKDSKLKRVSAHYEYLMFVFVFFLLAGLILHVKIKTN